MNKKSEMIGFKTTPEIKEALEEMARKDDRTVSYIVNKILKEYIERSTKNGETKR